MTERLGNLIVKILKGGSIPNVVYFGDVDVFPEPPYVVVKPENGVNEGTRTYRIIAHINNKTGGSDRLEDYVLKELDSLLLGNLDDEEGSRYKLFVSGYTDLTPSPTDNSYFMERLYSTPLTIRS